MSLSLPEIPVLLKHGRKLDSALGCTPGRLGGGKRSLSEPGFQERLLDSKKVTFSYGPKVKLRNSWGKGTGLRKGVPKTIEADESSIIIAIASLPSASLRK